MRKTKTLKGMSLIECIVALAVMSIMASLLIICAVTVFHSRKNTDRILGNTAYETPYAERKQADKNEILSGADDGKYALEEGLQIIVADVPIDVDLYSIVPPTNDGSRGFTYFEQN